MTQQLDREELQLSEGNFGKLTKSPGIGFLSVCVLIPVIVCAAYINAFAVDVVCADDWAFFGFLNQLREGHLDWMQVFFLHYNNHRLFFTILYQLCLAIATQYNEITIEYGCLVSLTGTAVVTLAIAAPRLERLPGARLLLALVPIFVMQLKQWENLIINCTAVALFPACFFVITAMLLDGVTKIGWRFWIGFASAFVATYSAASGFPTLPSSYPRSRIGAYFAVSKDCSTLGTVFGALAL